MNDHEKLNYSRLLTTVNELFFVRKYTVGGVFYEKSIAHVGVHM